MLDRTDPPLRAHEAETLVAFLDYHRATFRAKVDGVDAAGLALTIGRSTMTLGGLMKHLTLVEDSWFSRVLLGNDYVEPWASHDWESDPDWEWRTGATDPADETLGAYDVTVARVQANIAQVIAAGGVESLSVRESRQGDGHFSLRWILLHMLEEYARHNGHADLLRESVDGTVGE
jgi:uncharacterized damage-inducible protein DinB